MTSVLRSLPFRRITTLPLVVRQWMKATAEPTRRKHDMPTLMNRMRDRCKHHIRGCSRVLGTHKAAARLGPVRRPLRSLVTVLLELFERGVTVSYETTRRRCDKVGACFSHRGRAACIKPGTTRHLNNRAENSDHPRVNASGACTASGFLSARAINLTGDYLWRCSAKIAAGKFRPLRSPTTP